MRSSLGRRRVVPPRAPISRSLTSGKIASCLFLSSLWPEPDSSAAGVRTEALLHAFQSWGFDVSYAASSSPKPVYVERLASRGITTFECGPNREDELRGMLESCTPDVVVFDRFFTEEAFSFRVRDLAPGALRVLDMQDVHSLRRGRQLIVEKGLKQGMDSGAVMDEALAHVPPATSNDLLRELAAVHRSDLILVCSPVEKLLLQSYGGETAIESPLQRIGRLLVKKLRLTLSRVRLPSQSQRRS